MSTLTVHKTIAAIADRSHGVQWISDSEGLALIRSSNGYVLVAETRPGDDTLGERVVLPREDGQQMPHGHTLTPEECERAIKHILGL
jgi:hypothetical protein